MSLKSIAARWLAHRVEKKVIHESQQAIAHQQLWLQKLINTGRKTLYGADHQFDQINNFDDYVRIHPVQHYEDFIPYIEKIKSGESNVLWKGKPLYFAKTSGTTAGAKYIPISHESMPHHIQAARNALLCYIAKSGNSNFVSGKMIFLQGSPVLDLLPSGIPVGRLSGIVAHHIPQYLQKNRLPSFVTNSIEDWETKVNKIAEETLTEDMRLISGIPSWVQMYFEVLIQKSGKNHIKNIFPNFSLFVFGGVHYEPYRKRMQELMGGQIDIVETFPASEGFFAYQDDYQKDDLLLNTNAGIFYEFIKSSEYFDEHPKRYPLWEVEKDMNYALIITTNAGLWSYSIGDTVKFTSIDPYRIKVTGRIKHYTSAFGEHVIAEEVEKAITTTMEKFQFSIDEFHVAPMIETKNELPYHEWWIETQQIPNHSAEIAQFLDEQMVEQNIYYKDLITGKVLQPLKIQWVKPGTFHNAMKKQGKLGGQNKMPRLSNDRVFADLLST
jgi:GH3 auxin-responsive promoter